MPVGATARAVLSQSGPSIVDSFEDGNLDEYDAGSAGGTSDFSIVTDSGFEVDGSNALIGDTDTGGFDEIISTSGLDNYPDDSTDIYRVTVTQGEDSTSEGQVFVDYRVQDADNMWRINLEVDNDDIQLDKRSSGSSSTFASTTATLSSNQQYMVECDPTGGDDNDFVARVYETDENGTEHASLTSDSFNNGETGIGFAYKNVDTDSERPYFDYARVI